MAARAVEMDWGCRPRGERPYRTEGRSDLGMATLSMRHTHDKCVIFVQCGLRSSMPTGRGDLKLPK